MKTSLLFAITLFATIHIYAQSPPCQWVRSLTGATVSNRSSIATDAGGNVYVTGYFSDTTFIAGNDTFINDATNGAHNMYIVKYDSLGNVLWARNARGGANEGTENVEASAVGTDANGNAYVLGSFQTPVAIFGNDTLVTANYFSFLAKYTAQGDVAWAINEGGTLNSAYSMVVDAQGNSYICGAFTSGSIIGGTDTIPVSGYVAGFVIKYDSSGNSLWAAGITGSNVFNYGVALDAAGNLYLTGAYTGDSVVISNNITLTNPNAAAMFTVKYNPGGNVEWAQNVTVNHNIYPSAISTDGSNNIYVTGNTTSDTLIFGTDTAYTGDEAAPNNIFVASYDASGNARWVRCSQGYNNALSMAISADASGHIFVTGDFYTTTMAFGNDTLVNIGEINENTALFIASYDSLGNIGWALGGISSASSTDEGAAIEADNKGHLYVTGNYSGTPVIFCGDTLPFYNGEYLNNVFITRYNIPEQTTGISNAGHITNGISVYPNPSSGRFYFKGATSGSTLQVFDVLGQQVYSDKITSDSYILNMPAQAKGIYFYRVVDSNARVQEGKIVVE